MIDRTQFTDEEWNKLREIIRLYIEEHGEV